MVVRMVRRFFPPCMTFCWSLAFTALFAQEPAGKDEAVAPTTDAVGQYQVQRLYARSQFDCPVALALMPLAEPQRPRLVVALQRGEFWVLPEDEVLGKPLRFLDLRERLKEAMLFEEGVHGLAFHPDFAVNRKFYVSYSTVSPRRTVLVEMRCQPGEPFKVDPASERVVLEERHIMANHFGGGIAFGPDKKLYLALGDGGLRDDPYRMAQNPFSLLGKMLRIDVDSRSPGLAYGIPEDNPFAAEQTHRPEIWALGLRNPWGFSFDTSTGELWLADVGQDIWEEVNLIKKGANYGWSDRDGPRASPFHLQPFLPNQVYEEPVHAYTHAEGISVTGGFVYRGSRLPRLHGCYIHGDWGLGTLWALRYNTDLQKVEERMILHRRPQEAERPFNPTMIAPDAGGEIMILSQDGAIYTLLENVEKF